MEYKIVITLTDTHVVYVEADNDEAARTQGLKEFMDGNSELVNERMDVEVEDA